MIALSDTFPTRLPPFWRRLSTRIVTVSLDAATLVLIVIAGTLCCPGNSRGRGPPSTIPAACACAPARSALPCSKRGTARGNTLDTQIAQLDATLATLRHGDAQRPLFLPNDPDIRRQLDIVMAYWTTQLKRGLPPSVRSRPHAVCLPGLPARIHPGGGPARAHDRTQQRPQDHAAALLAIRAGGDGVHWHPADDLPAVPVDHPARAAVAGRPAQDGGARFRHAAERADA